MYSESGNTKGSTESMFAVPYRTVEIGVGVPRHDAIRALDTAGAISRSTTLNEPLAP